MDLRSIPLLVVLGIFASFADIPHFEHARDHGIFLIPFTLPHEFGSTFVSAISTTNRPRPLRGRYTVDSELVLLQ